MTTGLVAKRLTLSRHTSIIKGMERNDFEIYRSEFPCVLFSAPSSAPRDLTSTGVESKPTWVMLSWQPPRHINGHVTGKYGME